LPSQTDVQAILEKLEERDDASLITHLRALSELALSSPKALETKAEEVHEFVMREVIHKKSTSSEVSFGPCGRIELTGRTTRRMNGRKRNTWTPLTGQRLLLSV